jgi:hypothetical protein
MKYLPWRNSNISPAYACCVESAGSVSKPTRMLPRSGEKLNTVRSPKFPVCYERAHFTY